MTKLTYQLLKISITSQISSLYKHLKALFALRHTFPSPNKQIECVSSLGKCLFLFWLVGHFFRTAAVPSLSALSFNVIISSSIHTLRPDRPTRTDRRFPNAAPSSSRFSSRGRVGQEGSKGMFWFSLLARRDHSSSGPGHRIRRHRRYGYHQSANPGRVVLCRWKICTCSLPRLQQNPPDLAWVSLMMTLVDQKSRTITHRLSVRVYNAGKCPIGVSFFTCLLVLLISIITQKWQGFPFQMVWRQGRRNPQYGSCSLLCFI